MNTTVAVLLDPAAVGVAVLKSSTLTLSLGSVISSSSFNLSTRTFPPARFIVSPTKYVCSGKSTIDIPSNLSATSISKVFVIPE